MNNEEKVNKDKTISFESDRENMAEKPNDSVILTQEIENDKSVAQDENIKGRLINNRYEIESLVGHGGMCYVYRAKDRFLDAAGEPHPYVAIKILQKDIHSQPDAANILVREAKKTQLLSHPNIIRVYDFGVDQDDYYLVMEWLDGQTLDEIIKSHRPNGLGFKSGMALLKQLMSALHYAHKNNVIHADLKPGNIMLTRDGTIKIFDFGVSQAVHSSSFDQFSAEKPEEDSPVSGYTPTYASPERLKHHQPTFSDDIFAFSCIAYELFSSKHPFSRKTADQASKENISLTKPKNLPYISWYYLRKGLAFDVKQRYLTIEQLENNLSKNIWKPAVVLVAMCVLGLGLTYGYLHQAQQLQQARNQVSLQLDTEKEEQALMAMDPEEFLSKLDSIPQTRWLQKQAVLRKNHQQIISIYEKRIDDLLHRKGDSYPDYYAIQSLLQNANTIYPDSYSLTVIADNINQAWMSTIDALVQRINTHLEHGHYQRNEEDADNIYSLYEDLKQVKKDYTYTPTSQAKGLFVKNFEQAYKDLDIVALSSLIQAGNVFFSGDDLPKDLLKKGASLEEAITEMAAYRKAKANNREAVFPEESAKRLYQSRIEALHKRVKSANRITTLEKINRDLNQLAKELPDTFSLVVNTRQLIADKYLYFSDYLLKRKRTRRARVAMERARELMSLTQ